VGFLRRVIPANTKVVTAVVAGPDPFAVQAASLGVMTNTFSPAAAGIHTSGQPRGYTGDPGFGVNRWAGKSTYPLQHFSAAVVPIADPRSKRVGIGAGTSAQSGLPNTGTQAGLDALGWMSMGSLGPGMGG